ETGYSHSKDYDYDPLRGLHSSGSTLVDSQQYNAQWGNVLQVGAGTVSAGVDWQDQIIKPDSTSVNREESQNNTGIYLTGQQRFASIV
ncbi:vitamin B12/cobalamin outer membrane transporter, partial [Pectobacterium parmentieri]|nr:vitamin B12/cobalamin outer membrane transporter [Pectobacterium parmentieri]